MASGFNYIWYFTACSNRFYPIRTNNWSYLLYNGKFASSGTLSAVLRWATALPEVILRNILSGNVTTQCVDIYRVKPCLGLVHRQCFNLYWMTNQPYVTGQELTGNQCIQPPILHQYTVSLSRHKPAHLAVFLSLLFSFSLPLFFWLCLCGVLLWKPQHLYFKDIFVSLLCIQMIRLAGRRMQLWGRVCWWEWRGGSGKPTFGVGFLPTRSLLGDDSWRNAPLIPQARVTWPSGSLTFKSDLNGLGGQWSEIRPFILRVSCTLYAHHDSISFRSRNMGLFSYRVTRRCGCVWPSLAARLDCTS